MKELSNFSTIQLEYLTSYITKNERVIKSTIKEITSVSQRDKQKYESYLVQFVRLLCKHDANAVEEWVEKSYFPPEKCLPVVQ